MSQQASSSRLEKMAALKENADTKDYSILVTGATGFIGKKLLERLAKTVTKLLQCLDQNIQTQKISNLWQQMHLK